MDDEEKISKLVRLILMFEINLDLSGFDFIIQSKKLINTSHFRTFFNLQALLDRIIQPGKKREH